MLLQLSLKKGKKRVRLYKNKQARKTFTLKYMSEFALIHTISTNIGYEEKIPLTSAVAHLLKQQMLHVYYTSELLCNNKKLPVLKFLHVCSSFNGTTIITAKPSVVTMRC